ncbi:MAG: hypothetical protein NDI82_04325, partial [Anaeromyxobacteraceae bacterium]|nr:hypothetical protein [Anaeromyxobacteraceae bacterium]
MSEVEKPVPAVAPAGSLRRHFVRFSPNAIREIGGITNFEETVSAIFADLFGDDVLRYTVLQPNEQGPRVLISGKTTLAYAGLDDRRRDTKDGLFVYNIQAHVSNTPSQSIPAKFFLLKGGPAAAARVLDQLTIFSQSLRPDLTTAPNPALMRAFAHGGEAVASALRSNPGKRDAEDRARGWTSLWRTFRLASHVDRDIPARSRYLLEGTLEDGTLAEWQAIGKGIGVKALNSFAEQEERRAAGDKPDTAPPGAHDATVELVKARAALPWIPEIRAELWSWAAYGLPPDVYRRELVEAASFLEGCATQPALASPWSQAVQRTLRAFRQRDTAIGVLCDHLGPDFDP